MWYPSKLYILILATMPSYVNSSFKDPMADCLLHIVGKSILPVEPSIQIRHASKSQDITTKFKFTIEAFREKNKNFILDLTSDGNGSFNINFFIYFIDSLQSLEQLVESQQRNSEILSIREPMYHLIILPKENLKPKLILEKIFRSCWNRAIVNVLILQENGVGETINVYTFYPFTERKCRDLSPRIHNHFMNGSFQWDKPLFIPKVNNLQGCPVTLILPYNEGFSRPDRPTLFGQQLLQLLSKEINFTVRYNLSPYGKGDIFSPSNMTDVFKMLHDGLGDFIIDTWCSKVKHEVFEGVPYAFNNELIVFKSPEVYNSLEILLLPFDKCTWKILSFFSTVAVIVHLEWKRISRKLKFGSKYFKRYVLGTWILSTFVLRSSYEGSLFKFLHNQPRKALPNNFQEALDQGYKFIIASKYIYSAIDEIQNNTKEIIEGGESGMHKIFKESNGKIAWIISKKYLTSYNLDGQKYVKAKQPLLSTLHCIYTTKHSFLTFEIRNKFYNYILPYGFQNQMQSMNLKLKHEKIDNPKSLPLNHLFGVFYLYFTLIGVSLIIFLIEHCE